MAGNGRSPSIRVLMGNMASGGVAIHKTYLFHYSCYFFPSKPWQLCQASHLYLLYTNKFFRNLSWTLLSTEICLNSFLCSLEQRIHALRLGVAARQFNNLRNKPAGIIFFYDNSVLSCHKFPKEMPV